MTAPYAPGVLASLPRHLVSATGIVFDHDGRVLVIRRADDGSWVPPGGMVELDEAPADAVAREVAEETGVRVAAVELSGVYKHLRAHTISLGFRCRVLDASGQAKRTSEASEVTWLSLDQVTSRMTSAMAARVLDACQPGPCVRTHDGIRLLGAALRSTPSWTDTTRPALRPALPGSHR
jgi:ADP-ribose pyrophosphatase YjhB (NUDIX family)